jgi:site-specific recombinase XerD
MDDITAFLAFLEDEDRSPHTITGYRCNLGLFAAWFEQTNGKPMTLASVTPLDIKAYRAHLVSHKIAANTVNYKLTLLKGFFRWAVEKGRITANPVSKIKLVKQARGGPRWLDKAQTYALLRAAVEAIQLAETKGNRVIANLARRNAAMVALMLHTGLRVSEVCKLSKADVEIGPRSGHVAVRYGKGRKYRRVPLNADARQAVSDWLQVCPSSEYLFASRFTGRPIEVRTAQYAIGQLGKAAGLARLTPHQLRHTFGKTLIDQGVSIDQVATLMGHSNLDTTAIYTRPSQADLQKAVEKIAWQD